MAMSILFVQTGGTLDKGYPKTTKGWAFEIGEPAFNHVLSRVNPGFDFETFTIFRKDSLEINNEDREKLQDFIRKSNYKKIIITHGTDTLIDTAKFLIPTKDQVIVLTGAQRPEKFKDSDADFNLGLAVGAVSCLSEGVYVAMNGIVCSASQISRCSRTGQFSC